MHSLCTLEPWCFRGISRLHNFSVLTQYSKKKKIHLHLTLPTLPTLTFDIIHFLTFPPFLDSSVHLLRTSATSIGMTEKRDIQEFALFSSLRLSALAVNPNRVSASQKPTPTANSPPCSTFEIQHSSIRFDTCPFLSLCPHPPQFPQKNRPFNFIKKVKWAVNYFT